ncbi:MAG: glycosyltransferase [Candidatus Aegiribacteria sp.]|nr:glycosyltransferase [Candidatus Aegiribacteria sp.]
MSSGKITYSLGFLPTYVFREIVQLNSEGFEIDIFLPRSTSTSKFWLDIVPRHKLADDITIKQTLTSKFITCSIPSLALLFMKECIPVFLRHPAKFCSNAFLSIRKRSFRYFLLGASLAGHIDRRTLFIHSHFAETSAFAAMWAGRILRKPFTLTTHAVDIFVPPREDMIRFLLEEADRIFTISEFNRKYISHRYGEHLVDKIDVTYLGLDFSSLPERAGSPGTIPNIICTASGLGEKKGVPVLLEACRILKERNLQFSCRVIGSDTSGLLLDGFRKQVEKLGLGDLLRFEGLLKSDEVMDRLAEADIFVLPSVCAQNGDMDGIPVSLMESMAVGVPTVSTSLSGIPELIENWKDGILVPPGNSEELANAIEKLLMNADFAKELGRQGSAKVRNQFNVTGYVGVLLKKWAEYL